MKLHLETQFEMIIQLTASLKTAVRDLQGQSKKHTAATEKREKEKQERQIGETRKLVEAQELAARKRITQLKAAAAMNIDWQAAGHTAFPTYADEAAATAAAVTNKQEWATTPYVMTSRSLGNIMREAAQKPTADPNRLLADTLKSWAEKFPTKLRQRSRPLQRPRT